jgi:hypothetical protein
MSLIRRGLVVGAGQVVQVSGQCAGGPDRQAVRAHHRLDVRAEVAVLAGIPSVDRLALDADRGLGQPITAEQLPVEDWVRPAVSGDPAQRLMQVLGLGGQHGNALLTVAVGSGPRDPETRPSRATSSPLRNQTSTMSAW